MSHKDKEINAAIEAGSVGQSFDDFLREQGTYEDTTERAVKRVIALQLATQKRPK